MPSLPVHWIVARAHCHATEEEERVLQALEAAVPGGTHKREAFEGQFGNPLLSISKRLEGSQEIRAAWQRWKETGIVEALRPEAEPRVDDNGILHFRLDKQRAFAGVLALGAEADAIDVQVKVRAYPATPAEVRRVVRGLMAEAD